MQVQLSLMQQYFAFAASSTLPGSALKSPNQMAASGQSDPANRLHNKRQRLA
jgi:hypothetical protein